MGPRLCNCAGERGCQSQTLGSHGPQGKAVVPPWGETRFPRITRSLQRLLSLSLLPDTSHWRGDEDEGGGTWQVLWLRRGPWRGEGLPKEVPGSLLTVEMCCRPQLVRHQRPTPQGLPTKGRARGQPQAQRAGAVCARGPLGGSQEALGKEP